MNLKAHKKIIRILVLNLSILLISANISFSQQVDSLRIKQGKNKTEISGKNQKSENYQNGKKPERNASSNSELSNAGKNQHIKQVKGARPDMSKARGARPPSVVRQSGSGIPRGMGKPGGAGKHGGR